MDFLLQDVDLDDDAETLSVGQKQRIALIRALLSDPGFPPSATNPLPPSIPSPNPWSKHGWKRLALEQNIGIVQVTHLDFNPVRVRARRYRLDGGLQEVSA